MLAEATGGGGRGSDVEGAGEGEGTEEVDCVEGGDGGWWHGRVEEGGRSDGECGGGLLIEARDGG